MQQRSIQPELTTAKDVRDKYGQWTAMAIHLGNNVYTKEPPAADLRLRRFVQLVADAACKRIDQLRVLDLACLEGHYAIEFALHGADVVANEIREANIEKARFAQRALQLKNLHFVQDDVRNLRRDTYGTFDVVLCAGILYHLDAPDVFDLVQNIYAVCKRIAILETFISLRDTEIFQYGGHTYKGLYYAEFDKDASSAEKQQACWSAINNNRSAWLTHPSLCNLLSHTGFTTVLRCDVPSLVNAAPDRHTYLAIKGDRVSILSSPPTDRLVEEERPERPWQRAHPAQKRHGWLWYFLKANLPQPVKNLIKPVLRALHLIPPDTTPLWQKQRQEQRVE